MSRFLKDQFVQIRKGGLVVLGRKLKSAFAYLTSAPVALVIYAISPWYLVRFGNLRNDRIGHFSANTELYFCERQAGINRPTVSHVDLFSMSSKHTCNRQLELMWKRLLRIYPSWLMHPIQRVISCFPGGRKHLVGSNTMEDQDVHDLLVQSPVHLSFSEEEKKFGEQQIASMGIPDGARFACITVRDSAYLSETYPNTDFSYHDYRDSEIGAYLLAADELASRGYYVVRMGAKVRAPLASKHPRVIDYATNGMRTEFMDIYLGYRCSLCISTATGWDGIPYVFRRPIVYVNMVPLAYHFTYRYVFIALSKRHYDANNSRELTLSEIFRRGLAYSGYAFEYAQAGVTLISNTPEEIRDLAVEAVERLNGMWRESPEDLELQLRFWNLLPKVPANSFPGRPESGKIRSRYGAVYLRNNAHWLQ